MKTYDKILEIDPQNEEALAKKGKCLFIFGHYEEAIKFGLMSLKRNPQNMEAWGFIGYSFSQLKYHDNAYKSLRIHLKINPLDSVAREDLAIVLFDLKRYKDVVECCDDALNINPLSFRAWSLKALVFKILRQFEESDEAYNEVLEIEPNEEIYEIKERLPNEIKPIALNFQFIDEKYSKIKFLKQELDYYDEYLEFNPQNESVQIERINILIELKRYEEANKACDTLINSSYNDLMWYYKGKSLIFLNHYDEAMEYLDKFLEINPEHDDALYFKAKCLFDSGNYEKSKKVLDEVLKINPLHEEADVLMWQFNGRLSSAEYDEFDKKDLETDYDEELCIEKANFLDDMGNTKEALKVLDDYLKTDSENVNVLSCKGRILYHGDSFEKAIKIFDLILEINPQDEYAWIYKATSLSKLGFFDESLITYDESLKINPDFTTALYLKGNCLSDMHRYDEAIGIYDNVFKINPDDYYVMITKGNLLFELNHFEEAIRCFDLALKINPEDSGDWYLKRVGFQFRDFPYRTSFNVPSSNGKALLKKGLCLEKLGRYEEAIRCYDMSFKFNNFNLSPFYYMGRCLEKLGRYEEAIESCYNHPLFSSEMAMDRGRCLTNLGRYEEAIECFDEFLNHALKENPNEALLLDTMELKGFSLMKLGHYEDAIKCFDRVLKSSPEKNNIISGRQFCLNNLKNK